MSAGRWKAVCFNAWLRTKIECLSMALFLAQKPSCVCVLMEIYFSKGIKWLRIHFDPASEVQAGLMAFLDDPFPFWGWCWGRKKFTVCAQQTFHRSFLAPFLESLVPGRVSTSPLCFHPKLQPATADHLCSCSWRNSNRAILLSIC